MECIKSPHHSPVLARRSRSELGHSEDFVSSRWSKGCQLVLHMPASRVRCPQSPVQALVPPSLHLRGSLMLWKIVKVASCLCRGQEDVWLPYDPGPGRQPFSAYHLPMGVASSEIPTDINNCITSLSTGMLSRKVSKLLPYPGVKSK